MRDKSIHPGMRIPLPDQKNNFLSLSYSALIVKVCNAILNLRLKNGKALISDQNLDLEIEQAIAGFGSDNSADNFHPFKIYQTPLADCLDPATFGRNFSVRGGVVEFFSSLFVQAYFETVTGIEEGNIAVLSQLSRYPPRYCVQKGDDAIWRKSTDATFAFLSGKEIYQNAATSIAAANRAAVTVVDGVVAVAPDTKSTQWILPVNPDGLGAVMAGFWVEITDDAENPTVEIKCQTCTDNAADATGRPTMYWPTDKIVFPLGIVRAYNGDPPPGANPDETIYWIEQIAWGHLINRFSGTENSTPMRYRQWVEGEVYYPGDVVKYDPEGINATWVYTGPVAILTDPPGPTEPWDAIAYSAIP